MRDGVERLESHWVRLPEMGTLRDTVVDVLELLGGVASAPHCAAGLLDLVGSTVDEPLRRRLAEALVRVAVDAELADEGYDADPRLVHSRQARGILVPAASRAWRGAINS